MSIFLAVIPVFVVISTLFMYRFTGRRELMKLDLVQFLYAFVISPVMYIWLKSFLFFIVRAELNLRLTLAEVFLLDGVFSLLFIYMYAFIVLHSLTKTFGLKKEDNPRYNLFKDSEYFHQHLSHLAIYWGGFSIMACSGLLNLFFPFALVESKMLLYITSFIGIIAGLAGFATVWMYETPDYRFYRIMKVFFGLMFLVQVWIYIIFSPDFSVRHFFYWLVFSFFLTLTALSLVAERSKPDTWWEGLPFVINWRKPKKDVDRYFKVFKEAVKNTIVIRSESK